MTIIAANTMLTNIATTRKGELMVDCMRTGVNSMSAIHYSPRHYINEFKNEETLRPPHLYYATPLPMGYIIVSDRSI